jgi:hypothetical protein
VGARRLRRKRRDTRCFKTCMIVEGVPPGRFTDEQVDVLGHNDVPNERKSVAVAHLTQNLHEQIL